MSFRLSRVMLVERTLCGQSLRTGSFIVAGLSMITGVIEFFNNFSQFVNMMIVTLNKNSCNSHFSSTSFSCEEEQDFILSKKLEELAKFAFLSATATFWIAFTIFLFDGLRKKKPVLMLPWIFTSAIGLLYLLFQTLWQLLNNKSDNETFLIWIWVEGISAYCFIIVYSNFQQMKREIKYEIMNEAFLLRVPVIVDGLLLEPTEFRNDMISVEGLSP